MDANFWNERYRGETYAYGTEPNVFLKEVAHRIPKGRVLCIAEGEGRNAVYLAGLGHEVTAIDFSSEGLAKTERLARERNVVVKTVQADLASYEPELDAFSGIVSIFAHVPLAIRQRVHGWVPRALRPGGVFVLEAYRPEQLAYGTGGPKNVALLMTLAMLETELTPLTFEIGREVDRDLREEPFHSGMSAVVQILAKRSS